MTRSIRIALAAALLSAPAASAQDGLAAARNLYASAEYEEALVAFERLAPDAAARAAVEIDRYRVLCLIALGRGPEADKVIEAIVANDPFYQPNAGDAAPRVQAAFSAVRQRMLPSVARSLYVDAKAAYDRKAYSEAVLALEKTVKVIDDIDAASRADLSDLRVLAAGFLDLSKASSAPPPVPAAPAAAAPAGDATAGAAPAGAASPGTGAAPAEKTEAPPVSAPGVPVPQSTSLVVLKQDLPPLPYSLVSSGRGEYRGIIEVDINETGAVTNARMVQAVHAFYDPLILRASREWKYEAPRVFGKPIPSRKRVEIVLRP